VKSLDSIFYFVSDIKGAKEWLQAVLQTDPFQEDDYFVGFRINSFEVCLHLSDEKSPNSIGNQVCYWEVDNLEKMKNLMLEKGATLYRGPLDIGKEGVICQVLTPFGFLIGLREK
jgi:predicted enzyme related to lactoylglutathione lyase